MSASGVSVAELLCRHVDLLRKQHRAGITPSFGQVEDLFEFSDQLWASQLRNGDEVRVRPSCALCFVTGELEVVAGRLYCRGHAPAALDVIAHLQRLSPVDSRAAVLASRVEWPHVAQGGA